MDEGKKAKWERWLKDTIWKEILRLLEDRFIYLKIGDNVTSNKNIPNENIIYSWLAYIYGCAMASGIRRQTETTYQCITLGRLLFELKEEPELISRADYVTVNRECSSSNGSEFTQDRLNDEFTRMAGNGDYLDPCIITKDFASIDKRNNKLVKKIITFADWFIAHHDKRQNTLPKIEIPKFGELHNLIDHLHNLFKKYFQLVTSGYFHLFSNSQKRNIEREIDGFFRRC